MRTVRRLYFYLVAFISLEVVLWGLIGLARTMFSAHVVSGVDRLAQALALILVGVPVFGLHWWVAQHSARLDSEEHSSSLRAVFLYAVLLALLIPVVQNGLALLDRLLLQLLRLEPTLGMIGADQTLSDNLIAMLMNGIIVAYFIYVLRDDWAAVVPKNVLGDIRRLYRYIWVLYTLIMAVAGVQQMLQYTLSLPVPDLVGFVTRSWFVNGLALVLIGVPLWVTAWNTAQRSLVEPSERASSLRLGVLFVLSLSGVVVVLSLTGFVLNALLRMIFGEFSAIAGLMAKVSGPLSIGIPLAGVWAYYGGWLRRDLASLADEQRRAGLRRLYAYILSLIGLVAMFIGVYLLLSFVIDTALGQGLWGETLRSRLCTALATVSAGLPLWLLTWRPVQYVALASGDEGDHARRSVVRKAYLYLVLFGAVIGGMASAVRLVFLLLSSLLGERPAGFGSELLDVLQLFVLFIALLVYHWQVLRRDGSQAALALAAKHALFPVMVLDIGDGTFVKSITGAVQKQTPDLPLVVQSIYKKIPKTSLSSVKAVILPVGLAVEPPEPLRLWLKEFEGHKVLVPNGVTDWFWTGSIPRDPAALAAQVIRQLAEGHEVRYSTSTPAWMVVLYVFGTLFTLQILFMLLALVASFFTD
jgi:uncharacterized membrane protein